MLRLGDSTAMLGLLGVLLGALIGAVPILVVSDWQIEAARDSSTSSFLRDKRQAAYAQYVADLRGLRESELNLAQSISRVVGGGTTEVTAEISSNADKVNERYSKMRVSSASLQLVASTEVRDLAIRIDEIHEQVAFKSNLPEYMFNQESPLEVFQLVSGVGKDLDGDLFPKLLEVARKDFN